MLKNTWRSIFIFIFGIVATTELASASPLSARPKSPQFYAQAKALGNQPIVSTPSRGSQVQSPQKKSPQADTQSESRKFPSTSPAYPPTSGSNTWPSYGSGPAYETKLNVIGKPDSGWSSSPGGGFRRF